MSQAFAVHHDENQVPRRGKMTTRNNGGQKRAALGVITNQVNQQVRIQPSRAAKPKASDFNAQDENVFAKKNAKTFGQQPSSQFSVFVDPTASTAVQKSTTVPATELPTALTSLPQTRVPLAEVPCSPDIICLEDSLESPMILDVPEEEKKPLDREAVILTVPEYEEDIYNYLREAEMRNRAKPGYMRRQQDITTSMRSILVDWLVEVSEEYRLHRETLFLAVNYIDRFLSKISVLRGKLQLVGAASMFLAAKYEEIYPPDVKEFAYITDDTYTSQQVLRMEHLILKVLTFDVAVPTTNWFCEDFLKSCDADDKLKSLTMFLSELTLVDMDTYLKYVPSITAAAALCLSRYSLGMEPWPQSLVKKTGYEIGHFVECLKDLHKTYMGAESHQQQAVQEKYKQDKYQQVSDFSKNPVPHNLALLSV
ncbi:Cyclin-A2 [Mactra antiquata]